MAQHFRDMDDPVLRSSPAAAPEHIFIIGRGIRQHPRACSLTHARLAGAFPLILCIETSDQPCAYHERRSDIIAGSQIVRTVIRFEQRIAVMILPVSLHKGILIGIDCVRPALQSLNHTEHGVLRQKIFVPHTQHKGVIVYLRGKDIRSAGLLVGLIAHRLHGLRIRSSVCLRSQDHDNYLRHPVHEQFLLIAGLGRGRFLCTDPFLIVKPVIPHFLHRMGSELLQAPAPKITPCLTGCMALILILIRHVTPFAPGIQSTGCRYCRYGFTGSLSSSLHVQLLPVSVRFGL